MTTIMIRRSKLALQCMALLLAVLVAGFTQQALSQDRPPDQNDDPPSRVARLGFMEGSVSFQPAGESEWVSAVPNRPMTIGDKIWSDERSRVEVQLGSAVIRLGSKTGMSFLNLDDRTVQIQLSSGAINVHIRRLERDENFEIDTPNLAFSAFEPGNYRLDASENGNYTVVTVREGLGEATGNGQNYKVHPGQRATFEGTQSLNADFQEIERRDDFDEWAYNRDREAEESQSARYVSHDVVGYQDLDHYGEWRDDPSYGHVWYPTQVSEGWAPYRTGHWAWISPWGWTWVDDAPWGYAPFHYGRWVSVEGRWGWVPGPPEERPVYAPALVVFVGGGPGAGGNVAWFPLGPREVYVPAYQTSPEYVNRVNVSNTTVNSTTVTNVYNTTVINNNNTTINNTNINNTRVNNVTYANRNVSGAVTAVPQHAFVSAQPVARAAVPVSAREIASAPVTPRVAVVPTQNSVLGAHANMANHVVAPPTAIANRPVIARAVPPPPPVPFAKQQQALAAHPGRPLERHEVQNLRAAQPEQAHPLVKQVVAPKAEAAIPPRQTAPAHQPENVRPGPSNGRPVIQPAVADQPAFAPPNHLTRINEPVSNGRPEPNPPHANDRPEPSRPASNGEPAHGNSAVPHAPDPEPRNDRPAPAQTSNHPVMTQGSQPPQRKEPAEQSPEKNHPAAQPKENDKP
jgi:uncharacterized protein DUF6600